jgi:hypothetical protein
MEQPPFENDSVIEAQELSKEMLLEKERVFACLYANRHAFGALEVAQISDYLHIDKTKVEQCLQELTKPGHWQSVERIETNPPTYRYAASQQ